MMLLPKPIADGVRDGRISVAYRRWDVPRVKVGSTQLTGAGVIGFDAVDEIVDLGSLSDADAMAAGLPDAAALRQRLAPGTPVRRSPRGGKGGERVFRIRLRYVGADPRVALREQLAHGSELVELTAAVAKLDAGKQTGPWTRRILEWIAANPAVVSTELAALLDRELQPMKTDIRKLKALGLTISLPVGYQLSPRGEAYLESLDRRPPAR